MRVTNNMIMNNANNNINGVKEILDKRNKQMTTQKKIDRPSDDPVVAVRSLRFSTSLAKIDQYYNKNIPDAESWLEVTETAVNNMRKNVRDVHSLCTQGAQDTLTQEDRKTILQQLKALKDSLYDSGNSDYAGRTVFTGYRTNKTLTFMSDESATSYSIEQRINVSDKKDTARYYSGIVKTPGNGTEILAANDATKDAVTTVQESSLERLRLGYNGISFSHKGKEVANGGDLTVGGTITDGKLVNNGDIAFTYTDENGDLRAYDFQGSAKVYDTEDDWEDAGSPKKVGENDLVVIKGTGDVIMGSKLAEDLAAKKAVMDINYTKTGFSDGDLRPEYYYNCVMTSDNGKAANIEYDKYNDDGSTKTYDINYTVAANQELRVNLEADRIYDSSFAKDIDEMISAVSMAVNAYDKVKDLQNMKSQEQYAGEDYQKALDKWISAANREKDYADNNMQKIFNTELGKTTNYEDDLNLAMTDIGCRKQQLELTKKQMSDQQETVKELQSSNDDYNLSEIVQKFIAARTAYQSSLSAAAKLGEVTLLNYL